MRVEMLTVQGDFYFCPTIFHNMNLQDILDPFVSFCQWTFKYILEPMTHWFNIVCIIGGFAGLFLWLRMQKKFTQKAQKEGGIV